MARLRIVNDRADDSTVTLHRVIVPRGLQSLCEMYIEAGYILKLSSRTGAILSRENDKAIILMKGR